MLTRSTISTTTARRAVRSSGMSGAEHAETSEMHRRTVTSPTMAASRAFAAGNRRVRLNTRCFRLFIMKRGERVFVG